MESVTQSGAGRICAPPVTLAAIALSVFVIPGAALALQFEPGRPWSALSGHLAHWNVEHLLWDTIALLALGVFCCRFSVARFWAAVGLSAVAIPAAVVLWQPELASYRGLSGIDSALLGLALVEFAKHARRRKDMRLLLLSAAVCVGFGAKLVFEFVSGGALFVSASGAEFVNVPLAHLVGFGCGVAAAFPRAILSSGAVVRVDSNHAPRFPSRRIRRPQPHG